MHGRKAAEGRRTADGLVLGAILAAGIAAGLASGVDRRLEIAAAPPLPPVARLAHRVDLDSAGASELGLLPGVGPRLARRIVEARAAGGPFASREDVDRRVPGVGPAILRRWRDRILPLPGDER